LKNHKKNKGLEPKYIQSLIEHNKKRERVNKLVRGRNMCTVTETDKSENGEKFITAAYKKILQERNQLEQEEAECDAKDAADDVIKKKDFDSIYSNLYKNIVMDGGTEKPPEPEQKHTKILSVTSQPPMDTKYISSDPHYSVTNTPSRHKSSRSRSPHCHRDRSRSPNFRSCSSNQRHYHLHRSPSDSHSNREDLRYSSHSNQLNRKRARSKSPVLTALEELTHKNQGKDEETKRTELVKKLKLNLDRQTDEYTTNAARQRYFERLNNKTIESVEP